ncbi:hypothetical protein [Enterococcus mundtii]|uniref:Uncharacterized protein n=1 Tax=Enterococcus mundtii TaxID=53346 RepID=A0A848MVT9_ENTMU|nr:hypothetical protein [Enterococcus mundtii]NMP59696.1 hypothetical protein [Enterococcus mundtii]
MEIEAELRLDEVSKEVNQSDDSTVSKSVDEEELKEGSRESVNIQSREGDVVLQEKIQVE